MRLTPILCSIFLTLLTACGQSSPESQELAQNSKKAELFEVVDYSPYRHNQGPGGAEPTAQEIREDLRLLKQVTSEIRVYGMGPLTQTILALAESEGLGVHIGAWLSYDPAAAVAESKPTSLSDLKSQMPSANLSQIESLIDTAKQYAQGPESKRQVIRSLIIGSETQYRHEMSDERLVNYISYVRQSLLASGISSYKITSAQIYSTYSPVLAQAVDFVLYHVHPLWEEVPISDAADAVICSWTLMRKQLGQWEQQGYKGLAKKPMVIGETGWATRGNALGQAQPSEDNQLTFLKDLAVKVQTYQKTSGELMHIMYFDAFDEDWKHDEGSVGDSWGLYDINRKPKRALRSLLNLPEDQGANPPPAPDRIKPPVIPASEAFGTKVSDGKLVFFVNQADWVDLHYKINGGAQQNLRMPRINDSFVFELGSLKAQDSVDYFFTIGASQVKDSPWARATLTQALFKL